jgi:uncharacterized repeat protein (TIGR01451 family)
MTTKVRSLIYLGLPVGVAVALLLAFFFVLPDSAAATESNAAPFSTTSVIYQESFETDGEGIRYTTSNFFNDGPSDHYSRTNGTDISNVTGPYSAYDGTYFWATEDTDDDGGDGLDEKTMVLNAIDISGYSNLWFKGLFGAGNESPAGASNYDALDYAIVFYSVDGAPFTKGLEFRYVRDGDDFNEPLAQDTDFDGIGDGTLLGTEMQEFAFDIPNGNSVVISITVSFDSASEEFGFDNLRIEEEPPVLLLTEIAVTPTEGEFIEIYNPGTQAVDLSDVYLTDATFAGGGTYYYNIVTGSNAGGGGFGDFHARFPDGASIAPEEYQVVALAGSDAFSTTYGIDPTYELYEDNVSADSIPDMREAFSGSINDQGGLSNSGEVVILYLWDGMSDLISDLDYAVWGDKAEAVDKTDVSIDGPDADVITSTYLADTAIPSQDVLATDSHTFGNTWQRQDVTEGTEISTGGNGSNGNDETSENLSFTWCEELPSPLLVSPCALLKDLTVEKTGPANILAGENLVYEITISNQNMDPATDVVLTDTLPLSTTYVSDDSGFMPTNPSEREYVWDFGSIISNTQMTFNLTVTVDTAVTNGTVLTNTVIVTTTATDDDPTNNLDEVETILVPNPSCGGPVTRIHTIQGNGDTSPEEGNVHAIEGIVVADYQAPGGGINGFFVQEDDANVDADPMTSEGILVYDGYSPAVDVSVGDVVRVIGTVAEYGGMTELNNISSVEICPAMGFASPATPTMPVASVGNWEWYEGMLVNFTQTLYVTEHYYLGRYGEISLSVNDRLSNPTQVVTPGLDANILQDLNDRSQIVLDDAITSQNPDPIIYPSPELSATNTLRGGDTLGELTGVMNHAYGLYLVEPVGPITFTHSNPRPTAPDPVGGSLQVASFNVLNYFSTIDDSGDICGPSGDMGCRGADSASEFTRQRDKIINAILTMDADIVGLMEIENHATDAAVDDLVAGLNAIAGAGTYAKVATGPIGTDAIKVALIYQTASATPIGSYAVLDDSFDANYREDYNRPALAQTFADTNGGRVTVVVNHLKSKGSDCDDIGDPDTGDGQGNCNLTRTAAAEIMLDWLATDPTESSSYNFLIIGDLNSYAMEDPIVTLEDGGYTNLYRAFSGDDYSYVFDGQWGTLDYSLASAALLPDVTGATAWHINSDEPGVLDYNEEYKSTDQLTSLYAPDQYRASDHDPIIVGLDLSFEVPEASFTSNSPITLGETAVFTNTSTGDPPLTYLWDFGDGITSTLESPTHIYEQFGTYTVTLTVENVYGSDIFTDTYTVEPIMIYLPIVFNNND